MISCLPLILNDSPGLKNTIRLTVEFTFTMVGEDHSCRAKPLNNPPFFPETISRPARITGESGYSGHNTGLNARAKLAIISERPERFFGERSEGIPESRSGPKNGAILDEKCLSQ